MRKPVHFQIPRGLLAGIILFNVLLLLYFIKEISQFWGSEHFFTQLLHEISHPELTPTFKCNDGPWGELEYNKITIEPPEELYSQLLGYIPKPLEWSIRDCDKLQLETLFTSAGLDSFQIQSLLLNASWIERYKGFLIRPPPEIVLKLKMEQRSILYSKLSQFPENPYQYTPFRFNKENANEWFSKSGISPETLVLIKSLLYNRGSSVLFSDLDLAFSRIPSLEEKKNLLQTLSRQSSLSLRIVVRRETDVPRLIQYWGKGGLSLEVSPVLNSLQADQNEIKLNSVFLLPSLPRVWLYTYPQRGSLSGIESRDCLWTSFNFFNLTPDDSFTNQLRVVDALEKNYFEIQTLPTFGDILILFNSTGSSVHAANYIADDIFFTKNGASLLLPWVLMKKKDMIAQFPSNTPLTERYFRLRNH